MVRLFLKLYGLLIATLAFSFIVQMQLMDYVWHAMSSGFDFHSRFRPTFQLLEQALAPLPPEQWPVRFSELSAGFGLPEARLVPTKRLHEREHFKPDQVAAFEQGTIVTLEREVADSMSSRNSAGASTPPHWRTPVRTTSVFAS